MPKKFDPTDFEAVVWGGACPPCLPGQLLPRSQLLAKRKKNAEEKKEEKKNLMMDPMGWGGLEVAKT